MTTYHLATIKSAPASGRDPSLSYANLRASVRHYEQLRSCTGLGRRKNPIMSHEGANSKLAKVSPRPGVDAHMILSLSLAPADSAGIDVCPSRSAGCTAGCLGHNAGHSVMGVGCANNPSMPTPVRTARIMRTRELFGGGAPAMAALRSIEKEIASFQKRCFKAKKLPAVRLNAFSDIMWEIMWPELFVRFPMVRFYDYTKIGSRLDSLLPPNYHLTLSHNEDNAATVVSALYRGHNVAMVFGVKNAEDMPKNWWGYPVLDGTADDMRFLDPKNCIVGLTWKGPTSKAEYAVSLQNALASGFAVSATIAGATH